MAKEILKDEILKDEELEQVAGGNRDELALDTQLFNAMGGRMPGVDKYEITNTNVNGIAARVSSLYSKLGVKVEYNDFGASNYYINGNWTPRNDVVKYALSQAGYHDMDPKQFQI